MSDITELERRITAALDRIGRGLDGLDAPAALQPQIDPEAEAKLSASEARVRELEASLAEAQEQSASVAGLEAEVAGKVQELAEQSARIEALERDAAAQAGTSGDVEAMSQTIAELEQKLSDEKVASAQAEERMKAIKEKSERHASAMEIQVFEHQQATAKLDGELQRLRRASEELRASNVALRQSLEEGMAEPHLLNRAMLSELETLRAARAVEIAQADAILATLEPLAKRAIRDAESAVEEESQDA